VNPRRGVGSTDDAGIWVTFRESSVPVRAMLLGIFVSKLGAFIQTFLVLFLTHRGSTEVQAGTALGGYGAGAVLGVLAGGTLADRLGARWSTIVSMVGSAALLVAVLYVRYYPALLVTVILVGAVAQLYRPASAALLSELTPKHRQVMIFAMYRLALNLGTTAAPVVAVLLVAVSYNLLFWAEAAAACCYAVIAAIALPRRKIVASTSDEEEKEPQTTGQRSGYGSVLADRRYLLYLAAMFINSAAYIQYVTTLPLAMKAEGLATAWYGSLITLNGIMVISCELLVTKVTQRLPLRLVVAVGLVLLGAGLSLQSIPLGLSVFVAGTVVGTLSEIVSGPTEFAYPGIAAQPGMTARYMGSMQAVFGLGTAIGPVVGVAAWDLIGVNAWWCWGLACLVALVLAWLGIRQPAPSGPGQSAERASEQADPPLAAQPSEEPSVITEGR
jgi:MFS family permease